MYRIAGNVVEAAGRDGVYGGVQWGNFPSYLESLSIVDRQSEGWFASVVEDPAVSGPVPVPEEDAIHIPVPIVPPTPPFMISKIALHRAIDAACRDAEFHAYRDTTPGVADAWADATVLMSNDPLILDALPTLAAMLPEGADVMEFLRSCEVGP